MVFHNYNYFQIQFKYDDDDDDNSNEEYSKLFYKLWRNLVIKNEIVLNLREFKKSIYKQESLIINNINQYENNINRYFYKSIIINNNYNNNNSEFIKYILKSIPSYNIVEELTINFKNGSKELPVLYHIDNSSTITTTTTKKNKKIVIVKYLIPSSVKILRLNTINNNDTIIPAYFIPPTIKELYLPMNYDQHLIQQTHNGLVSIIPLDDDSSLEFIDFGNSFNRDLTGCLSINNGTLKSIKLSNKFNKKLNSYNLPKNLELIIVGKKFRKLIKLNDIKNINFQIKIDDGESYFLDDFLYNHMQIGYKYNNSNDSGENDNEYYIPSIIEKLSIGKYYKGKLKLLNYSNVNFLRYNSNCGGDTSVIKSCINIKKIHFGIEFSNHHTPSISKLINLPPSLIYLVLSKSFNQTLNKDILPNGLRVLVAKNHLIDIELPLEIHTRIEVSSKNQLIRDKINSNSKLLKNVHFRSKF